MSTFVWRVFFVAGPSVLNSLLACLCDQSSSWGRILSYSGQSKGERGGTAFPHFLFLASVVPPPPIYSSPTWIQMLSVNCMLKSQWVTVNMLLVDFPTEVGVNASTDIQISLGYLSYKSYLLTKSYITEHWQKLPLTSTLRIAMMTRWRDRVKDFHMTTSSLWGPMTRVI